MLCVIFSFKKRDIGKEKYSFTQVTGPRGFISFFDASEATIPIFFCVADGDSSYQACPGGELGVFLISVVLWSCTLTGT